MAEEPPVRRRSSRGSPGEQGNQIHQLVHEIRNNLAAIQLWLATFVEQSCPECRARAKAVASGIRRNLAAMLASSGKLASSSKLAPRRRASSGAWSRTAKARSRART